MSSKTQIDTQWVEHDYGRFCVKFAFTIQAGYSGTDNKAYPYIDIHFAFVTEQIIDFGKTELRSRCDIKDQPKEFRQRLIDLLNESFMEEIEQRNLVGG